MEGDVSMTRGREENGGRASSNSNSNLNPVAKFRDVYHVSSVQGHHENVSSRNSVRKSISKISKAHQTNPYVWYLEIG